MKNYLKSLLLVFVLTLHCFAMSIIESEHAERLGKFTTNRQNSQVLTHTNAIYGVLNDENKISNRQATDAEKKTIFQSLMASEIIHGGIEEAGQGSIAPFAHDLFNQAYKDHYRIIDLVGQLSRGLIDQFKSAGYEGINVSTLSASFNDLRQFSGVATDLFMDWFYESLEQHYDEFSFFGGADVGAPSKSGKIDREWFNMVQEQYHARNTNIQTCKKGAVSQTWILNKVGAPVAIYKPSTFNGAASFRGMKAECLSGLLAKVMKIDDVVNRVIPVRVDGAALVFDPKAPTGTIERFLGFSDSQIPVHPSDFSGLMCHVCEWNKAKVRKEHESTIDHRNVNSKNYHILTQQTFREMFSQDGEYRRQDVESFAHAAWPTH